MISQAKAQALALKWAEREELEMFAKTGIYNPDHCLVYLMAVEQQIKAPEFFARPFEHFAKNRKELDQLEKFFSKMCPYRWEWVEHPMYGYRVPQLLMSVPSVKGLRLPI